MLNFCSVLILFISTITASFAQQCLDSSREKTVPLFSLAQNSLSSACVIQRDQYKCSDLEAELVGEEKKKVIQCDAKSIEENKLSNMNFGSCIFNGLKISGEQLLDLGALPGKIAEGVAKGFRESQLCNVSIEKKRELLTAFNLSVNDDRFKLSEQFLGRWLEEASCAEIDKLVYARYQNYQKTTYNERINDINAGKKVAALPAQKENSSDLIKLLKSAMSAANVRYECYTPKVKAEMICAGVTSLIVDTALGMGIKSAITKISAVVKSKKALSSIATAVNSSEKIDLSSSAKLLDADRKKAASLVLERSLNEAQEKAVIAAHEIGLKEGRGFFNYTADDLRKKSKILKEAGFSNEERALLMRNGITGQFSTEEAKKVIVSSIEKSMKYGNPKEKTALLGRLDKMLQEYRKSTDPAVQANYARILGEMAKSHDTNAAKGFYQMGLDKVKSIADKDPNYFKRTKTLDNYIELASHAGDQAAVKKGMSEYVKQQFIIEGKHNGWKNTAETANGLFDRLESDVAHYKKLGDKGLSSLESVRRKQKALLEEYKFIDQFGTRLKSVDADLGQFIPKQ